MPTYKITGPDGRKFKITGPNKEGALAALQAQMAQSAPQEVNTSLSGALVQGYDQAGAMVGKGIQSIGEYASIPSVENYGRSMADRNEAEIAASGYQRPEGADGIIKNLREGEFANAGKSLLYGAAEALPQVGGGVVASVGAGLAATTAPILGTAAAVGGTIYGTVNALGQVRDEKESKGLDPTANAADLTTAAASGLVELLPIKGGGATLRVLREAGQEAVQEGLIIGDTMVQGGEYVPQEVVDRLGDAAVIGGTIAKGANMTSTAASKVAGAVTPTPREDTPEARAEATFAQRIQRTAERGDLNGTPFNLKDVNTASQNGVRALIDATHTNLVGEMASDAKVLKGLLSPNDTDAFDDAFGKVQAQVGLKMARNKTKSVVTKDNFDALEAIVGHTSEGQNLLNLVRESQVLTKIHNDGYKGGVSQYTDVALPFDGAQNTYNSAAQIARTTLGPMGAVYAGVATGGASIPIQAGVGLGGRGIDAITGRRSRLNRFVKQNANNPGIETPSGLPSIRQDRIDQAAEAQRTEEAKAVDAAARTEALKQTNLDLARKGAPPVPTSPQGTVEAATGLDRSGVARILRVIQATNQDPLIQNAIEGYQGTVAVGGRVPDISPLIRAINHMVESQPAFKEMRVREPDTGATQAAPGAPIQTTSENYQRGIDDNKAMLQDLKDGAKTDATMSKVDKAKVLGALDQLGMNLGSDPGAKVNEIMGKLDGVETDAVAQYVEPYVMRVMGQQDAAPRNSNKVSVAELRRQANLQRFGDQDTKDTGFASYLEIVDPTNTKIPDEARPNLGMGDMYGMLPKNSEVVTTKGEATYHRAPNGDFYATANNPDLQEQDVVGYVVGSDKDTELAVVYEMQGKGIGGELQFLFRSEQPYAPTGGLTKGGKTSLKNTYGRLVSTGVLDADGGSVRNSAPRPAPEGGPQPSKPALQSFVNPLQIPDNEIDATRLNSSPSEADIQKMREGTYKPKTKRTLVEAADYMYQKWKAATGRDKPFEYTPENAEIISTYMTTEAVNALQSDANAIGWYDRKLKAAKRVVSLVDPRVTQSPDAEVAFDFALAITSNGQAVADNFKHALEVFRYFMDNGQMPSTTWKKGGDRNAAMVEAFDFFNAYQASGTNMPIQDFLDQDFIVNELKDWAASFNDRYGTKIKVPSSEGANEMVKGSFIAGPKIGQGFYQNIRGNYDPLTMDIWWMRMWNRHVGRPFEANKDLDKNRARVLKALQTKNQDALEKRLTKETLKDMDLTRADLKNNDILDEFVSNLESRYQSFYRQESMRLNGTGQKVPKPELVKATGTMKRNLSPQLQATPKGPGERSYMRDVTKAAIAKLRDLGYNIETADFQALMWYPEKQLFRHLGVAPGRGADNDYLDAAIMLAEAGGITNDQIQEALPNADGDGAVNNQSDPFGAYENGNRGTSGNGPGQEGQARQSIPGGILSAGTNPSNNPVRSRAPEVSEVKQETALVNASIEIGKPGSEFENGIKDMAGVEKLAAAYNIVLKFYNSSPEMLRAIPEADEGATGAYHPNKRTANVVSTGDLRELITALHETMHGVGVGSVLTGTFLGDLHTTNGLTGQSDVMGVNSLESVMDFVLGKGKSDPLRREILSELKHIQERAMFSTSGVQAPIRGAQSMVMMLKDAKRDLEADGQSFEAQKATVRRQLKDHQNYERSIGELTVDALQLYAHDPKTMKRVAPQTARMIRELFNKSGNKKIQFYSHPLAMVVAVVMAIMAKAGMEDEEEQQIPPGMLSPQPGMLTA